MTGLARLLIRRRAVLWVALGLLTLTAVWRATRLEFDLSFRTFFLDAPEDELAARFRDAFGETAGSSLVAVLHADDVLRADVLVAVDDISRRVEAIPHVERVLSLGTVPFIHGDGRVLALDPITHLAADGTLTPALAAELRQSPLYARRLVSPDGTTTAVVAILAREHWGLRVRAPTIAAFRATVERGLPPGVTARFTGYPSTEAEYAALVVRGFAIAQLVGLALIALSLWVVFRTLPAVVLPLVTVSIATLLVLGAVQLMGQRLTFTNVGVPLMMLVIGVAEVSFFVARYYEDVAVHGWSSEVAVHAMAGALYPGFIAAATTSAGFFALGASHLGLTRDFGFNMALAGLVTFLVAAVLMPGALAGLGAPPARALRAVSTGVLTRALQHIAQWTIDRSWTVLVTSLFVVVLGCLGASRVRVDQYATGELPVAHPLLATQAVIDAQLSGTFQTDVAVRARDGGPVTRPEILRTMERLQAFLAEQPGVVKTWSVVDYVKELQHAAVGPAAPRTIPDTHNAVAQHLLLLSSESRGSDLDTLLVADERSAAIALGTTDLGTDALRALRRRTDTFVHEQLGDALEVRFVGDYWEVSRGNDTLASDEAVSTIGSFLLIFPLVGVLLRSWQLTLLCLPPNLVPMLATLALMGFGGYGLRTATSIVLPVSLGIAVDTTTHFLTRAREEWLRDGSYPEAVRRALVGTGVGMAASTFALVMGFSAYAVPDFESFHHIGLLASWTMVAAFAANLFLTPALVLWFRPFGRRTPATDAPPRPARVAATS